MSTTKRDEQQRFKREELERWKNAIFFTFEMMTLLVVIGLCVFLLVGHFPFYFKSASLGLLFYIARTTFKHLTNKL
jgi:ABC-type phosphate transport system permease subunit